MKTILIIEDEVELVKVLTSYLEKANFKVISSYRGDKGLVLWKEHKPDLIILDLNLPGMDGLDVAKHVRRSSDTPIIMLTARIEETDQLIGLEIGADDFITKPFSPRILLARIRSIFRRTAGMEDQAGIIIIKDLLIDKDRFSVSRGEEQFKLTPTEYKILVVLAEQPGRVFSRAQLLLQALDTSYEGVDRVIDAHIKNIRSKIEKDPRNPEYIETVYGIGYRFADE